MSPRSILSENPNSVVLSGSVIVGAAIAGLGLGLVIEIVSRRKGSPTIARKFLKVVEHSIQGFALGSLTADYLANMLSDE